MMYYAVYESKSGTKDLIGFFTSKKKAKDYVKQWEEFLIQGCTYSIEKDEDMKKAEEIK